MTVKDKIRDLASPLAVGLCCMALTMALQLYRWLDLEESYIFLYDSDYICGELLVPGGAAQLLASFCTQFMRWPAAVAVVSLLVYGGVSLCLCGAGRRLGMSGWCGVLSGLPCFCLMLCLESNSYRFCGHAAMLMVAAGLWLYSAAGSGVLRRVVAGMVITLALCQCAGSAALVFAAGALLVDILSKRRFWYVSILYPVLSLCLSEIYYLTGLVPTERAAFMPGAYYLWNSSAYMMLYAWCSVPLFLVAARVSAGDRLRGWKSATVAAAALLAQAGVFMSLYGTVHSPSVYRSMRQRYYAKQGDWDAIINMDYTGETTPYTSYRNLALAHRGRMVDELQATRSYISYFMQNKTLVKKEDQQILSDIYYDCGYLAAARHSAFDTDIVTPGRFNPVETLKLAEINLVYGDYAVADKLLTQLEKTLFYKAPARWLRHFLYDDEAVAADPWLSSRRALIPQENHYTSPKGVMRDLQDIVRVDSAQTVARQFLDSFIILNHVDQ